ncbi:MAG: hypothetical protein SHS37scaffold145_56 [Phage 71_18]|nr:MAG: hypothetical protein SHS37scaffold145_56 [Phage 71_18]
MSAPDWSDLSDEELHARLVQRGVMATTADSFVRRRESAYIAERITGLLGDG